MSLFTLGLSLVCLLVAFQPAYSANAKATPADRCREWMAWTNPETINLLNDFNRKNPDAQFAFIFRKFNDLVYKFFNKQLHLEGAAYPPLPQLSETLAIFGIPEDNEIERYKLQMAFEALLVLLQKPNAEELMLEVPGLFSDDPATAKKEKKAFQEIAHFVKVRLRGVSPGDPKLAAFLFLSKHSYKPLGLPLTFRKKVARAIWNAPRNARLFLKRNASQPLYGLGNLTYDLRTQWMILRRNPLKPFAQRDAYAKQADELLNLRRTLREPHDGSPVFMTRKPKLYHFKAIPKVNDIISKPSGRDLPLLPEIKEILKAKPELINKAEDSASNDDLTQQINAAGRTWTIDTLTNFAHYVEDLMAKANDEKKLEELSKTELFTYLLEFMTPERITALVRGIEAAHKEQNEFLDSKRGDVENVLLHLQVNYDRYRQIPTLIAKNKVDQEKLADHQVEGRTVDVSEFSRLAEEKRS